MLFQKEKALPNNASRSIFVSWISHLPFRLSCFFLIPLTPHVVIAPSCLSCYLFPFHNREIFLLSVHECTIPFYWQARFMCVRDLINLPLMRDFYETNNKCVELNSKGCLFAFIPPSNIIISPSWTFSSQTTQFLRTIICSIILTPAYTHDEQRYAEEANWRLIKTMKLLKSFLPLGKFHFLSVDFWLLS